MAMVTKRSATRRAEPENEWDTVYRQAGFGDAELVDLFGAALKSIVEMLNEANRLTNSNEKAGRTVRYSQGLHWAWRDIAAANVAKLEGVAVATAGLVARVGKLEADLRKERAAKALPYRGIWKQGERYEAGEFVTYQGSIWHVEKRNHSRPGDDPGAYTLAVKRGQDGKDARP